MVSSEVDGELLKGHPWSPKDFLFCSLSGQGLSRRGTQISYNNVKAVLSSSLMLIGFDEDFVKKFGLHSLGWWLQARLILWGS